MPPAYAAAPAAPPAGPYTPWYRRKWAVITGSVAAGVILFLGGMAVGSTFDGHDRDGFRDFHGQMPGAPRAPASRAGATTAAATA